MPPAVAENYLDIRMHRFARFLIFATGAHLFVASAALAQSTLEERMTGQEFEQAGLDKLSPAELEFLNQWLKDDRPPASPPKAANAPASGAPASTGGATTPAPAVAARESATIDQRGLRPKESSRTPIEARIDGKFTGWSGRTRFKLDNGMVWQQVGSGEVRASSDSPKVTIEPKSLGSWKLYVEGVGRSVKVKRIK